MLRVFLPRAVLSVKPAALPFLLLLFQLPSCRQSNNCRRIPVAVLTPASWVGTCGLTQESLREFSLYDVSADSFGDGGLSLLNSLGRYPEALKRSACFPVLPKVLSIVTHSTTFMCGH
jgi:hypothetical protein